MYDNVKCCNCGYDGTVEIGAEICPVCKAEGTLAWKDGEPQEVIDDAQQPHRTAETVWRKHHGNAKYLTGYFEGKPVAVSRGCRTLFFSDFGGSKEATLKRLRELCRDYGF